MLEFVTEASSSCKTMPHDLDSLGGPIQYADIDTIAFAILDSEHICLSEDRPFQHLDPLPDDFDLLMADARTIAAATF